MVGRRFLSPESCLWLRLVMCLWSHLCLRVCLRLFVWLYGCFFLSFNDSYPSFAADSRAAAQRSTDFNSNHVVSSTSHLLKNAPEAVDLSQDATD